MFKAKYLSPMIPSFNIPKTVAFLKDTLGFTIGADFRDYFFWRRTPVLLPLWRRTPVLLPTVANACKLTLT